MKDKKYNNTVKNNIYILKLIWKINPARIAHVFISTILSYAQWVFFSVIFIRYIFGSAENIRGFRETAVFVIISTVAVALIEYYSSWFNNRYVKISDNIMNCEINKMLFEKAAAVDISCYENPDFYDSYTKAVLEASSRAMSVLNSLAQMFAAILSSFAVMSTMFQIYKISALFVVFPVLANFVFGKILNKIYYEKDMANVPFNRKQDYVGRVMYLQKYAKEIRLSKITDILFKANNNAYENKIVIIKKFFKKSFLPEMMKSMFCFILPFTGLWLYLFYCAAILKSISIGDFVVLSSAIVSATWMLIGLTDSIVTILSNGLYINNLRTFLNYTEKISENQTGIIPSPKVESLEFKNVSFKYDGAGGYSLKNINMKISEGEKIALVGINGAGKTTLVKLIMRLYDPTEGEVLLNGINIKEYNVKAYRAIIGTVFQDYQILSMTVLENVIMDGISDNSVREKAIAALKNSDLYDKISEFPDGADSMLTREFDDKGVILSGGQLQKIAVARAFAQDSSIMILDEPSSALDPIAEYKLYETIINLCNISKNGFARIGIFISHRLSSAVMADRIFMFEDGEIIEEGTHSELIKPTDVILICT